MPQGENRSGHHASLWWTSGARAARTLPRELPGTHGQELRAHGASASRNVLQESCHRDATEDGHKMPLLGAL